MDDLTRALKELAEAQPEYQKAEDYFEGDQAEVFASPRLRRALERTGTKWRLPFARTVVTSVRDRIEMTGLTSSEDRVQAFLAEQWNVNDMDQESDEVTQWFLVYGECYAMVWPDEDDRNITVAYNSPRIARVFYDAETGRKKVFGAKIWNEPQRKRVRATLYYPDRIEKYISKVEKPKDSTDFEPYEDNFNTFLDDEGEEVIETVWPTPNPFGEVPLFHFRTDRDRGRPEHRDAYSPQDMVNKIVITQMATNDFQGFPQRWALAGAEGESSDEGIDFDEVEDGIEEEGSTPRLNSGPGELWWLEGVSKVGQFSPAEVEAFLAPLREYIKAMAALTSTPVDFFDGMGNAPSGESLRVRHAPLLKKVRDRKQALQSTWKSVWAFAAKVGLDLAEEPDVSVNWAPSESYDDADAWSVVRAKQEAGIPVERTLVERGYSPEEVKKWYPSSDNETRIDERQVETLVELSKALQQLGTASQFGVVTPEQVQSLIARVMGDE